ncbi:MAG: chemotaxis protein CheV [Lachnospiraceae bacterium]|nr:chemotaxis protein CheV [Lachnospiraceae bacterium]MBQ4301435.1 chemotaxis protein CheV [Lachnospiraceae bacterium]
MAETNILLEAGNNQLELLKFKVAGQYYAINVAKTDESIDYMEVTPVPLSRPEIKGILAIRDTLVTVIDLKKVLFDEYTEITPSTSIILTNFNKLNLGFVVDEIVGISRFSWLHILKPEATISSTDEGIITGLVKDEDRIVCILDFEKIVSDINPQCGLTSSDLDASVMKNSNKREDYSLLVAEDSKLLNKLIVKSLLDAGYQVKSVWNGSEAWDEITAWGTREELLKHYQLLITDIEMPVMDGITLSRNVKKSDEYKALPICVFSSLVNEMLINKVKELEIDAMITKPEIGKLVEKIDSMLGISVSGK